MKAKTSAMISLDQARMLVAHLEQGEFEQADTLIADACAPNAAALFDKVGQLTRQLHDSLQDFRLDPRIPDLATHEIPDARERLSYVIDMTDKAANRTMDAVEASLNRPYFPRHLKSLKLRSIRRCYEQAATLHRRIQTGSRQAGD